MQRVADSLVLRWFCRLSCRRAADATTLLRGARTRRPTTLQSLLDRVADLAKQAKVTHARKLHVDATVVVTPIHSPTDSGILGNSGKQRETARDGVRILTRLVTRAKPLLHDHLLGKSGKSGKSGKRALFRNRMRATRRTLQALYRVVRQRPLYERLIQIAMQTLRQAQTIRSTSSTSSTSSTLWQVLPSPATLAALLWKQERACRRSSTPLRRWWRR